MELDSPISSLPFVGPSYANKLEKLGIEIIEDLVKYVPSRYLDFRYTTKISNLRVGDTVTVKGVVKSATNQYAKSGKQMQIVRVKDETGTIDLIWFNQRYILSSMKKGTSINIAGEVTWFGRKKCIVSPIFESEKNKGVHTGRLVPIYPETKGITSKWLRARINSSFTDIEQKLIEFLPQETLTKNNLVSIKDAITMIHFPKSQKEAEKGKRRLAFNELLELNLKSLLRRKEWKKSQNAHELTVKDSELKRFTDALPFELTKSQKKAISEIRGDLSKSHPMNRLLEGDVGSGKTAVAAAACFISFANGYQSIVMAPTQILADQHYQTLKELLSPLSIRISLVTSAGTKKDLGNPDIIVGTHALINKKSDFQNVALVVIDEQHRFGVKQRALLVKKGKKGKAAPDVLTMTATPIPRTVALTFYADLDLSTLDELPKGRKHITTWVTPSAKRKSAYKWIEEQINKLDVQVFVVCPLIEESENELMKEVKAVKAEYGKIVKAFPKRTVGLLHGRMKASEKDEAIANFKEGKTDILVTTPVIEVGIDAPNATIMVIEGADRFGLAALHQLRGRVGRGHKKSYCLLFSENKSEKTTTRLNAIKQADNGFELAEIDLQMRGPGEIFGTRQSGFPEFKIASWGDKDLLTAAKETAQDAANNEKKYKQLLDYIAYRQKIAN